MLNLKMYCYLLLFFILFQLFCNSLGYPAFILVRVLGFFLIDSNIILGWVILSTNKTAIQALNK